MRDPVLETVDGRSDDERNAFASSGGAEQPDDVIKREPILLQRQRPMEKDVEPLVENRDGVPQVARDHRQVGAEFALDPHLPATAEQNRVGAVLLGDHFEAPCALGPQPRELHEFFHDCRPGALVSPSTILNLGLALVFRT